jgi:hypothetical protein
MSPANLLRWFYQGWTERRGPMRPDRPKDRPDLCRSTAGQPDRASPRAAGGSPPAQRTGGEEEVDWDHLWIDLGGEG